MAPEYPRRPGPSSFAARPCPRCELGRLPRGRGAGGVLLRLLEMPARSARCHTSGRTFGRRLCEGGDAGHASQRSDAQYSLLHTWSSARTS